jgi:hypothetical protein
VLLPGELNVAEATFACLTKLVLDAPRAPRHTSWASAAAALTPIESLKSVPKKKLTLFLPDTVALDLAHWATAFVVVSVTKKIVVRASNCFFIGRSWVKKERLM